MLNRQIGTYRNIRQIGIASRYRTGLPVGPIAISPGRDERRPQFCRSRFSRY